MKLFVAFLSRCKGGQKRSDCLTTMLQLAAAVVAPGRTNSIIVGVAGPEAVLKVREARSKAPASRRCCNRRQPLCAAPHPGPEAVLKEREARSVSACLPERLQPAEAVVAPARCGFTLVELLVVIAIIGMLVGLLLPAVQQAREAARQMQCSNHLKQLGLATLNFEAMHRHYPSGGWWACWTGDPDAGMSNKQMGGWAYSLLPYLEQNALFQLGADGDPGTETATQKAGAAQRSAVVLPIWFCPSRRSAKLYENLGSQKNSNSISGGACKIDYAGNMGTNQVHDKSLNQSYATCIQNLWDTHSSSKGMMFTLSQVTQSMVRDGTSNTILLGEKYVDPEVYETATSSSDNKCAYSGADWGVLRIVATWRPPFQDRSQYMSQSDNMGSAHSGAVGVVLGDGSVQRISYSIDINTWANLGARNDGKAVALP
ncbi:MAG: DUF1559 domain-containing protein [Planctomycetia bacterium]|nr:DUF1559 domain-containing protein [Planctomycetia bacterium]